MSLQANEEINYQKTVEKYSNMVYRLAYFYTNSKYDADDIYQDVFLKYLQNKKQFENEEHKKAWLIKVTINSCKKMWLSAWKRKIIPLNDDEIKFEMEEDIGLYNEIKKLPKKYRVVIHLFYYEQYQIKDISRILNQKESTIRTWLTRARKLLKSQIKEEDFNV
ncbi:MAG: sigma-70 family RNA polymerase sigma factor [Clostridia bacterium]|nr:sigma-70 family RNA polymerase sigma factor [Clostridia bacterium]